MANAGPDQPPKIDREAIAAIAREVVARLAKQASGLKGHASTSQQVPTSRTERSAAAIDVGVVTAETITRLPSGTSELFVALDAIVTPAAKDEARNRNLTINHSANPGSHHTTGTEFDVVDSASPERAEAVRRQLAQRSCVQGNSTIILSNTPARELADQYREHGAIACIAGSLDEVERFAAELSVQVWILDMKRLNLTAAVNVAARIQRIQCSSSGPRHATSGVTQPNSASINKT